MSLFLHIDTALTVASICLSTESEVLDLVKNEQPQSHAAWLHPAIQQMMLAQKKSLQDLTAISVSLGPGSYTGLRVGLSSAKGLCYALQIPLLTIPTTLLLAEAVRQEATDYILPAIDARRNEIFTAIYDTELREIKAPHALILTKDSFADVRKTHQLLCCGNCNEKVQELLQDSAIRYSSTMATAKHLLRPAIEKFKLQDFANLSYVEPLYTKEFHSA
ncbi:MAG: tRNA (adenosine(37)-N6)-threonylcarbamoyltransferase complex dimerization subunit type 1 TsaB [Chitinophagaceae bacterium]|nr:tRNA (adenosine(37)-N6)-threonylcarbamoyltransferase complex dimerization subunit type 1 TsaB [Chitinophagaceae bacterium]HQU56247.1 tRNA (adenosine(37)-N6)-threonylcarbamoyltransferase complex dimerization subunit type 1 TsaB [Chitinophagaceae bacterium]